MKKAIVISAAALALAGGLSGCQSKADKVAQNISTQAENFQVQRRLVGINGITDKIEWEVTGRCSWELPGGRVDITCKEGPNAFTKTTMSLSNNVFFISTQAAPVKASEYHTKIILKPTDILPDFDLESGTKP